MRLSLRAQGGGFHPATMSPSRGYFHKKQKENGIKITSQLDDSLYTNCIYPRQLEILAIAMQVNQVHCTSMHVSLKWKWFHLRVQQKMTNSFIYMDMTRCSCCHVQEKGPFFKCSLNISCIQRMMKCQQKMNKLERSKQLLISLLLSIR